MRQYELWLADINPRSGTEAGKIRPVLILQTDLLNKHHNSTIICPLTTSLKYKAAPIRILLQARTSNLKEDSEIMIDQMRSIDNKRFIKKIGELPPNLIPTLQQNIKYILDIDS